MIPPKLAKVQRHRHRSLRDVADVAKKAIRQNRPADFVTHAESVGELESRGRLDERIAVAPVVEAGERPRSGLVRLYRLVVVLRALLEYPEDNRLVRLLHHGRSVWVGHVCIVHLERLFLRRFKERAIHVAALARRKLRRHEERRTRQGENCGGDRGKREEFAPRDRKSGHRAHLSQLKALRLAFRSDEAGSRGKHYNDKKGKDAAKTVADEHLPLALLGRVRDEDEIGGEHPPKRRHDEHQRSPRPDERDDLKPENPPERNHLRFPPWRGRTPLATRRVPRPSLPRRICRGSGSSRGRRYPRSPRGDAT